MIQRLKSRAAYSIDTYLTDYEKQLLDRLTPNDFLSKVHGDALIEASELIERAVDKDPDMAVNKFYELLALETEEVFDGFDEKHANIVSLHPRGIITFNYDKCHENAFNAGNSKLSKLLYSDSDELKTHLNNNFDETILIKAHGCVSDPNSLVLTSSSYYNVLNTYRTYRAVMQHIMSRFTVLIVGFGLRDRDFDVMLQSLEKDFGSSVQDHIVILEYDKNDTSEKNQLKIAEIAALEAQYGIKPLYVKSYDEIPGLLQELQSNEGQWITELTEKATSLDAGISKPARKDLVGLSDIGKTQVKNNLVNALTGDHCSNLASRSEYLYVLGSLRISNDSLLELFLQEVECRIVDFKNGLDMEGCCECIAHALVALRTFNHMTKAQVEDQVKGRLLSDYVISELIDLDSWLSNEGDGNPRLESYARSAYCEIIARSEAN